MTKKSYIVFISTILGILFLQACNNQNKETTPIITKEPTTQKVSNPAPAQEKKFSLVQTGGEASCFHYEIQDNGKKIETTKEIEDVLFCPSLAKISEDNNYFLFLSSLGLKTYDFKNKTTNNLMSFLPSNEGVSCNWNKQNTKIACVAINSKEYKNFTKVFTLELDQGKLSKKEIYDEKIPYHCGSICYTDIEFKDDKTLILGVEDLPKKTLDLIP